MHATYDTVEARRRRVEQEQSRNRLDAIHAAAQAYVDGGYAVPDVLADRVLEILGIGTRPGD